VRIRVRRVGGIAGNIALAAELETAGLPPDDAARLEEVVAGLPWGAEAGVPPHPDAFRYEIEVPDEPHRGTAVLQESALTGGLTPLRDQLQRTGVVEPAHRRPG
jgi:hypothetical protein